MLSTLLAMTLDVIMSFRYGNLDYRRIRFQTTHEHVFLTEVARRQLASTALFLPCAPAAAELILEVGVSLTMHIPEGITSYLCYRRCASLMGVLFGHGHNVFRLAASAGSGKNATTPERQVHGTTRTVR